MRATPVLIATIKPRVRQETPRSPAKTGAHQGDGARPVVEVVMAADSTRGGGPILAERRSVPGGDEAAVSRAGRSYLVRRFRRGARSGPGDRRHRRIHSSPRRAQSEHNPA